jgi:hypothetical protein
MIEVKAVEGHEDVLASARSTRRASAFAQTLSGKKHGAEETDHEMERRVFIARPVSASLFRNQTTASTLRRSRLARSASPRSWRHSVCGANGVDSLVDAGSSRKRGHGADARRDDDSRRGARSGYAATRPDVFWGVAMAIGNVMLPVLNLPLIGLWGKLLAIPDRVLYPSLLLLACIGVYSVDHAMFDLMLAAALGIVGFIMMRFELDRTSFLLGFILGPLLEENLRRALTFAGGDPTVFFRRPASVTIFPIGGLLAVGASPLVMRRLRRLTGAVGSGHLESFSNGRLPLD